MLLDTNTDLAQFVEVSSGHVFTALIVAVVQDYVSLVHELLHAGADINKL